MSGMGARGRPHRSLPERRKAWQQKVRLATGLDYPTITQARKVWRKLVKPRGTVTP